MARTFDATTERLQVSSPAASPAADGTVAFWLKPAWSSGDSAEHYLWEYVGGTSGTNDRLHILKFSDNNLYAGWLRVSPTDNDRIAIADTGLFTSGTWAHWAMTWSDSGNRTTLYKNGSQVTQRTDPLATWTVNSTATIGNYHGNNADVRGDMCECGLWNAELSDTDIGALAAGFSPLMVRSASLIQYNPMWGRHSPEASVVGAASFAVTGATVADHPRIIYPGGAQYGNAGITVAPAAGGSLIAWF